MNLILGRNNSGKSTLLDFLYRINHIREQSLLASEKRNGRVNAKDLEIPQSLWHGNRCPEIIVRIKLTENILRKAFSKACNIDRDTASSLFPEASDNLLKPGNRYMPVSDWEVGCKYINSIAVFKINFSINDVKTKVLFLEESFIDLEMEEGSRATLPIDKLWELATQHPDNHKFKNAHNHFQDVLLRCAKQEIHETFLPFVEGKIFKRVYPDRNILPDEDDINHLEVDGNGKGVTNIIQNFYNKEELDRSLVEIKILSDLNLIFKGDACFARILPRRKNDGKWEIALEEENKGLIPLSQSGSSLKTVMIVLVYLYLVPLLEKQELSDYAFLIEEIENNLHPSLLRRLLSYVADRAKEDGCIFFLATHSSIAIDMFIDDQDAQIIHVTHDGESSYAETVDTSLKGLRILDDLGVKASDLLQANGIIWVEGPSDVIYIDKWLEMYCRENQEEKPRRRINYEFQMFGGTLLDSLCLIKNESMSEEEERKKLVAMFSFSRNAFVVIDSDAVKDASKGKNRIIDQSSFEAAKTFISSQFNQLNDKGLNLGLWYKAGNTRIRTLEDYLDRDTLQLFPKKQKPTKKIYAQRVIESWGDSKRLDEFPHGLKGEIQTLYELIKKWNQ